MPLAISPWVLLSVLCSLVQILAVPSGVGAQAVAGAIYHLRTGGSLVAHIKVGETYHQRKEVSEVIQGRNIPGGSHSGIPVLSLS